MTHDASWKTLPEEDGYGFFIEKYPERAEVKRNLNSNWNCNILVNGSISESTEFSSLRPAREWSVNKLYQ